MMQHDEEDDLSGTRGSQQFCRYIDSNVLRGIDMLECRGNRSITGKEQLVDRFL